MEGRTVVHSFAKTQAECIADKMALIGTSFVEFEPFSEADLARVDAEYSNSKAVKIAELEAELARMKGTQAA